MQKLGKSGPAIVVFIVAMTFLAMSAYGQPAPTKPVAKTIFLDHDGNQISNNEFIDIRLANYNLKDATLMRTLEDGTVEFRLQKVPQEGMAAPNAIFETLDGKSISVAELRGKVVVLNFWFIGCPACRSEMPQLNELRALFDQDEVVFIAATADPASDVRKYLARERFDYIHAAGADMTLKQFVFSGYPKNIVIGKTGEIVYWRSPVKAWQKFESVIREELAK